MNQNTFSSLHTGTAKEGKGSSPHSKGNEAQVCVTPLKEILPSGQLTPPQTGNSFCSTAQNILQASQDQMRVLQDHRQKKT